MKLTIYSLVNSLLLFILIVTVTIEKPYFGFIVILSPIILVILFATNLYAIVPYTVKTINNIYYRDQNENKPLYNIPISNLLKRNILIFIVSCIISIIIFILLFASCGKENHKLIFNLFPGGLFICYFILHYFYSCKNVKKQVYPDSICNIKFIQNFKPIMVFKCTETYIKKIKRIIFIELLIMSLLPVFGVILFIPLISKLTINQVIMLFAGISPLCYSLFLYYKNKLYVTQNISTTVDDKYIIIDAGVSKYIKVDINNIDKIFALYNANTNNLDQINILYTMEGNDKKLTLIIEGFNNIELLLEFIIYKLNKSQANNRIKGTQKHSRFLK